MIDQLPPGTPVGIYARVSGDDQARCGNCEQQISEQKPLVARNGHRLHAVYQDGDEVTGGRSATAGAGKLAARTDLHRMLADMASGAIRAVYVWKNDRLTRDMDLIDRYFIIGSIQRARGFVIDGGTVIDPNTVHGQIILSVGTTMSAADGVAIVQNTQRGKRTTIAKHGKPHGMPPYGLKYDRKEGWSIDPVRGPIVCEIMRRIGDGETCPRIAADMIARKVPPPRRIWQRTSVWTIARTAAERYTGRWRANKNTDAWVNVPRIVSDAEAARASSALVCAGHDRRGLRVMTRHVYMIDHKFAKCAACGGHIGIEGGGRDDDKYYACRYRQRAHGSEHRCTAPRFPVKRVDPLLFECATRAILAPAFLDKVARAMTTATGNTDQDAAQRALDAARKRVADADRKATMLAASIDALPPDAFAAALERVGAERKAGALALAQAEAAERAAGAPRTTVADVRSLVERVRARIPTATPTEQREIVRAFLTDVVMDADGVSAVVTVPRNLTGDVYAGFASCSTSEPRIYILTERIHLRAPRPEAGRPAGRGKRAA